MASMETLDDSTKDPWNQENGDATDAATEKVDEPKKAPEEEEEKKLSAIISSIQNYNCSLGEIANTFAPPKTFTH